ncbi:hypothetical protein QOT17_017015 [Balamuthia mandrillaris]
MVPGVCEDCCLFQLAESRQGIHSSCSSREDGDLDATPAKSSMTYSGELIMNGVHLNALSRQTTVIPERRSSFGLLRRYRGSQPGCDAVTFDRSGIPSSVNRPPPTTNQDPCDSPLLFAKGPTNTSSTLIEGIRQRLQNVNRVFFVMAAERA